MSANHRSHSSGSTLNLAGALRRLPGAVVKPIALLMAAAIALGGVTLAQSWMGAQSAEAVTRNTANWNGVFTRDQLWFKDSLAGRWMLAVANPSSYNAFVEADFVQMFQPSGSDHGLRADSHDTIAVGPIFKYLGDETLHMVDLNQSSTSSVYVSRGNGTVDGYSYGAVPTCSLSSRGAQYSAEINQKNGYLYAVGGGSGGSTNVGNNQTTITSLYSRILTVNATSSPGYGCVVAAQTLNAAGGQSLRAQWAALTGQTETGNWDAGSDMAIDANGNLYLMLTNSASQHALLRVNIPFDANGQPLNPTTQNPWTYEIVRAFTANTTSSAVWGMAFMDGALYTAHANDDVYRWDPLSGIVTDMGNVHSPVDLASAQAAPVISGTVYNDVNGDGVISGASEVGVSNVTVEIFQGNAASGSTTWTKRGEVVTNAAGNYSALLNSASTEFTVRVKRPQINGVNASQTYASAGVFYGSGSSGPSNTLTAYCTQGSGRDYQAQTTSGACSGARYDGIDALNTALGSSGNPYSANGGGAIVSKVAMTTDQAVVEADFGITMSASWGDSPLASTTNAQLGPYANPKSGGQDYLYLGGSAGIYADGVNHASANAHPTDDGVEFAPVPTSGIVPADSWGPAQSQLMVAGKNYRFRIKANGDSNAVAASTIKAWITSVNSSGVAASSFDTALSCATKDEYGYLYCDYTAGSGLPSSNMVPVYLRARVSSDPAVSAVSRGPSDPNSMPWVPSGEVEDYQLGVAGSVLRLYARTTGGVAANVRLALGNVSNVAPSQATTSILTNAQGSFSSSTVGHAITSRTQNLVITTSGVGGASASALEGWELGIREIDGVKDTYCYNTETGAPLATTVIPGSSQLGVPASGSSPLPQQVSCYLTYIPQGSVDLSTVTAEPSANQDEPVVVPGSSTVELAVQGQVRDANGDLKTAPVEGGWVTLKLSPQSGSPAGGAKLQYSSDSGVTWVDAGDTYEARIGADGDSLYQVRVLGASAGGYNLAAQIGSDYLKNKETGNATSIDPVQIWFDDASAEVDNSFARITATANQIANRLAPDTSASDWGKQTITVTLQNSAGQPYKNGESELRATSPAQAGGGLYYAAIDGQNRGLFTCAEGLQSGRCESGTYTLVVYAAKSGSHNITVTYTPKGGTDTANAWVVLEGNPNNTPNPSGASHVTAVFTDPPASGADSVLIFNHTGESVPEDTLDASDQPDGVGQEKLTGYGFHPTVKVWDAGRNNALAGKSVQFRIGADCAASLTGGVTVKQETTDEDGVASTILTSNKAGSCKVEAYVYVDAATGWVKVNDGEDLNGEGKVARWKDAPVSPAKSDFTVSTAWVVANGSDTGTVTVTLIGQNDIPVTKAADAIHASAALPGANLTISGFEHTVDGVYTATFKGTTAGEHPVSVTIDASVTADGLVGHVLVKAGGNNLARLESGPAVDSKSVFIFKTVTASDPETLPADDPAGVVVARKTGGVFHPQVNAFDANGNPVGSAGVRFRISSGCAAQFGETFTQAGGFDIVERTTSDAGTAQTTISSTVQETCRVFAEIKVGDEWKPVGANVTPNFKDAVWQDPEIDYSASYYSVSEAEVVADGNSALNYGTVTVYLQGKTGHPLTTAATSLAASADDDKSLLEFSAFTHTVGGVYTAKFWGVKAGDWDVSVEAAETPVSVQKNQSGDELNKQAHMVVPPASASDSILIFNSAAESDPFNDWDDTAVVPNGVGQPLKTGQSYHPAVRVWDAGRNNPVPNVYVQFTVPPDCVGTFQNSQRTHVIQTDGDGKASTTLTSTTVGSCQVTAGIGTSATGPWTAVPGGLGAGGGYEKRATWQDPDVDLTKSYFRVSEAPVVASNGEFKGTVTVTLIGTTGHTITTGAASLGATGPSGANLSIGSFTYQERDGVYTAPFWGTKIGDHPVSVTAGGKAVPVELDSSLEALNDKAHLVSGPVDPGATSASLRVDQGTVFANGSAYVSAWMVVQDRFGNPITGADATLCRFALEPAGTAAAWFGLASARQNPAAATGATGSDGKCTVQIRSLTEGNYPVAGAYFPGQSSVYDEALHTARFNNDVPDRFKSSWTVVAPDTNVGSPYARADASDVYKVTVLTRSASGAIVNGVSVRVFWQQNVAGATQYYRDIQVGAGTNPAGTATLDITSEDIGDFQVWVQIGGDRITTTVDGNLTEETIRFEAGPPAKWTFASSEDETVLNSGLAANHHWAEATVTDAYNNPVVTGVYFALEASKSAQFINAAGAVIGKTYSGTTSAAGVVRIRLVDTEPETVHLVARLGGATGSLIGEADLEFDQVDPPHPGSSSWTVAPAYPATKVANGSQSFIGTITVLTEGGLPYRGYTPQIEVSPASGLDWATVQPTGIDGKTTVVFTSEKKGVYTVNAKVSGESINTLNQRLQFVAGEPDPSTSTLVTSDERVLSDGLKTHTADVYVRDATGNAISGVPVWFAVAPGTSWPGPTLSKVSETTCDITDPDKPAWCDQDGKARVTITSQEPGDFQVQAWLDAAHTAAKEVLPRGQVQFGPGQVDPANSSRTVSPNTDTDPAVSITAGTEKYAVTVEVRSAANLLVNDASVRLVPVGAGAANLVVDEGTDLVSTLGPDAGDGFGKFTWHVGTSVAGNYLAQVQAYVNGEWVSIGAQVALRFKGGDWVALNSWLVEPGGSVLADGVAAQVVRVHALDANGNDASSGSVVFSVPVGVSAVVGSGSPVVGGVG
ncbi:MAG: hypothetical protein LBD51_03240, partial [Bifidobacteriaceae bacterium]|nr:hypothetical protein [Bifidobacteriaceae bacterium]